MVKMKPGFKTAEKILSKSQFSEQDLEGLMEKVNADFREEGKRLLQEATRRSSKS